MKKVVLAVAFALLLPNAAFASGETIGSLSHIHQVKVLGKKILLGTHEGLYQYQGVDKVLRMSPEVFDVMGLSIDGKRIYASGHPGPGSKFPEPVGLVLSTNSGKDWRMVALQGKVDFHLLESSGFELYGADSQSGELLYSKDQGKRWASRGKNNFSDIALSPVGKANALALSQGKLFETKDSFKTRSEIPLKIQLTQIEWNSKRLVASSGADLMISSDMGRTWKKQYSFKNPIGILAHSNELLVAVVGSQVWRSSNEGRSFALAE